MKATEKLRRLLSERGVRYDVRDSATIKNTYWDDADGRRWGYTSDEGGPIEDRQLFLVRGRMDLSPEQVVDATLGRGECHLEVNTSMTAVVCDRCNYPMPSGTVLTEVHFCPNCGRRIKEVDE